MPAGRATIKVDVDYDIPAPPPDPVPPAPPASVEDNVANAGNSSLSGSGDSGGATSDRTVPNTDGGTTDRRRTNPLPAGTTFTSAKVTVTLDGSLSCCEMSSL